jgi:hypothetical protein
MNKKSNNLITKKEFVQFCGTIFKEYGATLDCVFEYFVATPEAEEEVEKVSGVLPELED